MALPSSAVPALVLGLLALGPCLAQQDPAAEFDAVRARAVASGSPAMDATAKEALDWFLRIEDPAARRLRLPAAAAVALDAGRPALAVDLGREAMELGGATPALAVPVARGLAATGRFEELVVLCRSVGAAGQEAAVFVAMDPAELARVEGQVLPLADRAMRSGRTEDALWVFDALVQADPDNGVRLANLALTLRHLGRRSEAAAAYRQAMEVAPTDDQIRSDHGLFLRACGNWAQAAVELRRAMELEAVMGAGPAVTNLVQMEVLRPGSSGIDAAGAAARALAVRPEAAMLRRLNLDLVGDRLRNPDKRTSSR